MSATNKAKKRNCMPPRKIAYLISRNRTDFDIIKQATDRIRDRLSHPQYSDGKNWKGDELVGWIGEVYGKLFWEDKFSKKGKLVGEDFEYDLLSGKDRVSIKTRKGSRWQQSGAIPRVDGKGCPTHLMFIHLDGNHEPIEIWVYPWKELRKKKRFKKHMVRNEPRSYIFREKSTGDQDFMIYQKAK